MNAKEALLASMYEAFNRQDLDSLLPHMHPDVDWPNYVQGGRMRGREALRAYWTSQFKRILPETVPIHYETLPNERVRVTLAYAARQVESGNLWLEEVTTNTYTFDGDLITRMDWGIPDSRVASHEVMVERLFDAFNRKDAAALSALLHPHVDWPDLFGTERLRGRPAVQAMWTYQFGKWNPHVSLLETTPTPDGGLDARVSYVIHNLDGRLFTEEQAVHSFEFRDGFISRMQARSR